MQFRATGLQRCFFFSELKKSKMSYRKPAAKAGEKKAKFELTEEQKQEIREAFDLFDTDGSGECGFFRSLGVLEVYCRFL